MTKEQKYAGELKRLGIYDQAFEPAIHQLAILEREQSRTRKSWKTAAATIGENQTADRLYSVILQQDNMILRLRESLGLTPKALWRFRPGFGTETAEEEEQQKTPFELILEKRRAAG